MSGTETQQKQMQSKQQQQERIFQVTDGLRSKYTKRAYHLASNQFLREAQRLKTYTFC
ncbi:MAG: hypothetical protein ACRD8W_21710 [Nitrososphaeraceae archaeon]